MYYFQPTLMFNISSFNLVPAKKVFVFGVILVPIFLTFTRIWTEYGGILRISPYSVQMRENTDMNNSEYGRFSRSVRPKMAWKK